MGIIYIGQVISALNFTLAQNLGLQEKSESTDPLFSHDALGTARWDLLSLWILPVAGVIFLLDYSCWNNLALIGGAVYIDTGGRQAIKLLDFRSQRIRVGTPKDVFRALSVYIIFMVVGIVGIIKAIV